MRHIKTMGNKIHQNIYFIWRAREDSNSQPSDP